MNVVLLLSDDPICDKAESYAHDLLNVVHVQRHPRNAKHLDPMPEADVLLNFLSAPRVPFEVINRYRDALNFHPAPPEYPGVGSASLALYDLRKTHGVTVHRMRETFDSGEILRVARFPIEEGWGYKQLWQRSLEECLAQFIEVCCLLRRNAPIKQHRVEQWSRIPYTRREFEAHPAFETVAA